jgi:Cupin-like domain
MSTTTATTTNGVKQRSTAVARSRSDEDDGVSFRDANQKQRRRMRGAWKIRRLWQSWATKNPQSSRWIMVFVVMCLMGMMVERYFYNSGANNKSINPFRRRAKFIIGAARIGADDFVHSDLKERIRKDKAREEAEEEGEGDDGEGDDEESEEEEEEEEAGDDRRPRQRGQARGNPKPNNGRHFDGLQVKVPPHGKKNKAVDADADEDHNKEHPTRYNREEAESLLSKLEKDIVGNVDGGIRWIAPYLMLPPLVGSNGRQLQSKTDDEEMTRGKHRYDAVNPKNVDVHSEFFKVKHKYGPLMKWENEYNDMRGDQNNMKPPPVDYVTHPYDYPQMLTELPDTRPAEDGSYPSYPPLQTLGEMMTNWPQDLDFPGAHERPIPEVLLRFNYSNPEELAMATKFRDAELPFKLYDIPDVTAATLKWTDAYVAEQFDGAGFFRGRKHGESSSSLMDRIMGRKPHISHDPDFEQPPPRANGQCQESANNFFAFFLPNLWDVKTMGLPPVRNNDWSYEQFSKHARYADAVALNASMPHFYWQSGVPREERNQPKSQWTFISRDLPSLSSPTKTFFVFNPEDQKGIQCRFGERGVVAATHYDSGRNMIAMVTGAKRYILAPPKECPNLGIVPWKFNAAFRHSLLNFGHINYMNKTAPDLDDGEQQQQEVGVGNNNDDDRRRRHGKQDSRHSKKDHRRLKWKGDHMSQIERQWMEIASSSKALETVLKAGEVLYIPSHWFHYIVSLQKSAQCNVRSGIDNNGSPGFGGMLDVKTCGRLSPTEAGLRG